MAKAIALFSGGLDSQLAVKLLLEQGIEIECLTSSSVFHHSGGKDPETHPAVRAARRLGVTIRLLDTNADMMELVKRPKHGRGRNMNPCIDCRIFLLRKALERLRETAADFIATGEVLGQRPMSQQRNVMALIDREAGVRGLVLRPLSARLFDPTEAEKAGLVDREKLLDISGRSRKEQMALAQKLGITDYPTPAGGCLLTDPGFASRFAELLEHGDPSLNDVELLRVARHFRLDDRTKLVLGRQELENARLEELALEGDLLLDAADAPGPTALLRGLASDANIAAAARLTLRYGKARNQPAARVIVRKAGTALSFEVTAAPTDDIDAARLIITRD